MTSKMLGAHAGLNNQRNSLTLRGRVPDSVGLPY
jgi:hypothetical protein